MSADVIDYDAFRDEVRAFIAAEYTQTMREKNARQAGIFAEPDVGMWWHRTLFKRGWVAPSWPEEYGGTGWNAMQRRIFAIECASAETPSIVPQGLSLVGPAIMKFGTDEQKTYFLPRILSGDCYFCQGFSEAGSGSDLASLRCVARRDGNDYIVDGAKIWTTHAQFANWIFLLVRTSKEGKPQQGISFLVAPMDTPGISVRPIISISGDHELNETLFTAARISIANRIGDENKGWDVTKYLLEFERSVAHAPLALGMLGQARKIAAQEPGEDGQSLWDDVQFRRRAAELEIDLIALGATEHRVASSLSTGGNVGEVTAAILKITGGALRQQAAELCVDALGDYAFADQRATLTASSNVPAIGPACAAKPTAKFLNTRATTIYGGSAEVLHNLVARAALEMK